MNAVIEKWEEILQTVKSEYGVTDVPFNTWLKPLKVYEVDGNLITVAVPSEQAGIGVNYITKRYKIPLQVTICVLTGMEECEVQFVLEKDLLKKEEEKKPSYDKQNRDTRYEEAHLNPKYTFDTFVVGSNNKFAQAAALAVAESPGDTYNPLFIYGGAGLGKTHLMHSIAHFILEHDKNSRVLYVTSEEFTNELIETIRNGNNTAMSKFREKYRNIDVLLVDDIQFIIGKESTQEEFFHTFNALHSAGKQIILTSDKPPKDMETLEERIRSRFEWGLMADIGAPDYETRMAILRRKVESDDMSLSDDILNYIANNIKSNIRELEGALNKLLAYSNLEKTEITMEIAKKELQNIITPDKPREITPQLIIEVVSEHFQISLDQMISKNRSNEIARPRQIAMYLCKTMTDIPLDSIGSLLGGRDHSTIIHGIKKIADEYDSNEQTRNLIETIKKKINPN